MKVGMRTMIFCCCLGLIPAADGTAAVTVDNGMTVLITGANRGLGLELARQYRAMGYHVIGTARKPEAANELHKLDVQVEQLDVADSASVRALARRLRGTAIDILVNNAGIAGPGGPSGFLDTDFDGIDRTFQVNSLGPMRVTQALYENLSQGRGRKIVNITSIMGSIEMNNGGFYGYRASKAALNMFNKSLSAELGRDGFICIVLHPGWVRTDLGGSSAPLSPAESVSGMIAVIEKLVAGDNGRFLDYRGEKLPW